MGAKQKSLLQHEQARFEDARRQMGLAAMDFSIPDEQFLELRSQVRRLQNDVKKLERKSKSLFGLFSF
ncbi:hypothetical protein [Methylocystis echinoides]|jgi:hypothetical protein|uniref:hypothetical protein n=1 Tax=Methylocystis echinoides TaxID=29468 RepID=UPI00341BFBF3